MKIELHIGRLVAHGRGEFDREAFEAALRQEILGRLPAGSDVYDAARRFEASRAASDHAMTQTAVAETAAGAVARRLLP